MKANTITIIALMAFLVLGLFIQDKYEIFSVTGNEALSRSSIPSEVDAGETLEITYTATGTSGDWASSILDKLICENQIIEDKRFIMISDEGTTKIVEYTFPNTEDVDCVLQGDWKFGDKDINNFPTESIHIKSSATPHFEKRCYSSDVYWYDSEGVREDLFESCSDGCENGVCKNCAGGADENCDGDIDRGELGVAISAWIEGDITRSELGSIIMGWAN